MNAQFLTIIKSIIIFFLIAVFPASNANSETLLITMGDAEYTGTETPTCTVNIPDGNINMVHNYNPAVGIKDFFWVYNSGSNLKVANKKLTWAADANFVIQTTDGATITGITIHLSKSAGLSQDFDVDVDADINISTDMQWTESPSNTLRVWNGEAKSSIMVNSGKNKFEVDYVLINYTVSTSAISGINNDNSCHRPQYFDIHGRPTSMEHLIPGLYIRRQGSTSSKIIIK